MPYHDRKSTRLNSSHGSISYAVFCLKKKKKKNTDVTATEATDGATVLVDTTRACSSTTVAFRSHRPCTRSPSLFFVFFFFFNDTATTEIYTLSLHDALPI